MNLSAPTTDSPAQAAPGALDLDTEFPILARSIYFNHASVAPLPARAATALHTFADESSAKGGAGWGKWKAGLEAARGEAGTLLGVDASQIGLIHNTAHGVMCVANSLNWRPGDNVVVGEHEFPANVHPWRSLAERGVAVRVVAERPDRRFTVDDFIAAMDSRTRVAAVSLVQYSTGFRMPIEALAEVCRKRGVILSVDAIQAAGGMPTRVEELGCDFFAAGGQKWLLAVNGIGIMWVKPERIGELNQVMTGWVGRPRFFDYSDVTQGTLPSAQRFEEGTQNVPGALALGGGLSVINAMGIDNIWKTIEGLNAQLVEGAERLGFKVESPRGEGERSGIIALSREGLDAASAAAQLEREGINIAPRRGWLRFSPHGYNNAGQVEAVLAALARLPK